LTISIISDTHSFIDEQLIRLLKGSDEIWHAGDVGSVKVIDELERITGNLRVVSGNIDGKDVKVASHDYLKFTVAGLRVLIIHIAGNPPRYNPIVRKLISETKPDLLVCGHSHILKVVNDPKNGLLFINPGACGNHGFHKVRTMIKFDIKDGKPTNMRVIELGKRGKIIA
jgi:putative phosphoesterase